MNKDPQILIDALTKIIEWNYSTLPPTGLYWPNSEGEDSLRPMSLSAAYGSNGVRDYYRQMAEDALNTYHG